MNELLLELLGQSLRDVVLVGVVDLDCDPADFVPLLGSVYLEVGEQLIELSRDERTVQVRVAAVDAVRVDCEMEDTQRVCRTSAGRYVLADPMADNRIRRINVYVNLDEGVMAIEFTLACGQMLFFDPSFVDGFNFGGSEQRAVWLENSVEYKTMLFELTEKTAESS